MDRLFKALDTYNALPPAERESFEQSIWARLGQEKTVLVLDMSGFSRIAREKGIVFYLAMVRRMQHVSAPIVTACNGAVVKFEADNLFAVLDNPADALRCAIRINQALHADNRRQQDEIAYIRVSIGIEHGRILLVPSKDFFSDVVNVAAKLGEDLADASEILVGPEVASRLPKAARSPFETRQFEISGITIGALSLRLEDGRDPGIELYEGTPLD